MDILYCSRTNLEQYDLENVTSFLDYVAADRLQTYFKAHYDEVHSDMTQIP